MLRQLPPDMSLGQAKRIKAWWDKYHFPGRVMTERTRLALDVVSGKVQPARVILGHEERIKLAEAIEQDRKNRLKWGEIATKYDLSPEHAHIILKREKQRRKKLAKNL